MSMSIKTPGGKVFYYQPARGDGKSLLNIIRYCHAQDMSWEEIEAMFDKVIKRVRGNSDGILE